MKKCPYCGKENQDDTAICVKCHAGFPNEESKSDNIPEESNRGKRKRQRSE